MSNQLDAQLFMSTIVNDLNSDIYQLDQEVRSLRVQQQKESLKKFVARAKANNIVVDQELIALIDPSGVLQTEMDKNAPLGLEHVDGQTAYMLLESHLDSIGIEGLMSEVVEGVAEEAFRLVGVSSSINKYKKALTKAMNDLIGVATGTLSHGVIKDTATETEVFGTPEQFSKTMTQVKHITDVVAELAELTLSGAPGDETIEQFHKDVLAGIRKLISYGVPMSSEGGARISAATFTSPYFKIAMSHSGWTSEKVNEAASELKSVDEYCDQKLRKPATDLHDLYKGHTTLQTTDKMRGRAVSRAIRYEMMLIRKTHKLVKSLQTILSN